MKTTFFVALCFVAFGCQKRELTHSASSIDELAGWALDAIENKDVDRLHEIRINRNEFEKYLWPEFPASHNNVPFNFAWDNLAGKSGKGARRAVAALGGQAFYLQHVYFLDSLDTYPSFVIHTKSVLVVKDKNGETKELQFCGSIVERKGEFKFLSYRD